jgi:hypothetical protein
MCYIKHIYGGPKKVVCRYVTYNVATLVLCIKLSVRSLWRTSTVVHFANRVSAYLRIPCDTRTKQRLFLCIQHSGICFANGSIHSSLRDTKWVHTGTHTCVYALYSNLYVTSCVMAQAVRSWHVVAEARVRSRVSACEIGGRAKCHWDRLFFEGFCFYPSLLLCECCTHSLLNVTFIRRTSGRSVGPFTESIAVPAIQIHWAVKCPYGAFSLEVLLLSANTSVQPVPKLQPHGFSWVPFRKNFKTSPPEAIFQKL